MITVCSIGECMIEMQRHSEGAYRCRHGGDTFNTAQYAAWISNPKKVNVQYFTALGSDSLSSTMLESWRASGIDTDLVLRHPERNSGLYFAHTNESGDRDYIFYRGEAAAKEIFSLPGSRSAVKRALEADLIYASAISLMILSEEDRHRLVDLFAEARQCSVKTAFDTNYRPRGWQSKEEAAGWIDAITPHVDILLAAHDENQQIFGFESPKVTLEHYVAAGALEVVVRCGAKGSIIGNAAGHQGVAAHKAVRVLDTTAAGDSFNAAYLISRLNGLPPRHAALNGGILAAEVILHPGAIIPKERVLLAASKFVLETEGRNRS